MERAERKKKAKEAREAFRGLLEEAHLKGRSIYVDFAESKWAKVPPLSVPSRVEWSEELVQDERFKKVEKGKEREVLFREFVDEIRLKEKEAKVAAREKVGTINGSQWEAKAGLGQHKPATMISPQTLHYSKCPQFHLHN